MNIFYEKLSPGGKKLYSTALPILKRIIKENIKCEIEFFAEDYDAKWNDEYSDVTNLFYSLLTVLPPLRNYAFHNPGGSRRNNKTGELETYFSIKLTHLNRYQIKED